MDGGGDDFYWRDTSPFAIRFEKSAAALEAIDEVLRRRRPLRGAEEEFASLLQDFRGIAHEARDPVWKDPYAYFWVRIAYELLGATLKGGTPPLLADAYCRALGIADPGAALERHLGDFKRLLLGAAFLVRRRLRFERPLSISLPAAIPGTRISLTGRGTASLRGCDDGHIDIEPGGDGADAPGSNAGGPEVRIEECPLVTHAGSAIRLQPYAYNLPALEFAAAVVEAGMDLQLRAVPLLENAFVVLRVHQPETFEQIRAWVRMMAFRRRGSSTGDNLTFSDFPGSLIASVVDQPFYLAEVLIHEFHHNRLFFLEEIEPFLEMKASSLAEVSHYYSPWRTGGRPLHGVLHGVYVHVPVCRFWLEVLRRDQASAEVRDLARDRVLSSILQLNIGTHQLSRHARFTTSGRRLFEQLRKDVAGLECTIGSASLPYDVPVIDCAEDGTLEPRRRKESARPVTVRQIVRNHLEASDLTEQTRDVLEHVSL